MDRLQWREWGRQKRLENRPEIWKPVVGYEGLYKVSNFGRVKSLSRKRGFVFTKEMILKGRYDKGGYLTVSMTNGFGIIKNCKVHRIVGTNFIENLKSKPIINHINGLKNDNRLVNLEWVTKSENSIHNYHVLGYRNNFHKNSRKVNQYTKSGDHIREWESIRSVERELHINSSNIGAVCNGKKKTSGGYIWKYT